MSNKMIKKILILILVGFVMGCFVNMAFGWSIITAVAAGNEKPVTLVGFMLLGAINGMICVGGMTIYDIESWSLARCTITHFVISMSSLFITGSLQGWLSFTNADSLIVLGCSLIGYFIIWIIMYLISKKQVKELNKNLERLRQGENKEDN